MLYDNFCCLSDMFHHFLLENPELFHVRGTYPTVSQRRAVQDGEIPLRQRLEMWLDTAITLTEPTHRAMLLQLADTYEMLLQFRDTAPVYHNSATFSHPQ